MLAAAIASKSGRTELSGGFEPDAREGRRVPGLAAAAARWRKTATGRRGRPPDQAAEDRSRPPAGRCSLPLSEEERLPCC